MESKGTQKDDTDVNASGNSPLMMGYEVSWFHVKAKKYDFNYSKHSFKDYYTHLYLSISHWLFDIFCPEYNSVELMLFFYIHRSRIFIPCIHLSHIFRVTATIDGKFLTRHSGFLDA